MKIEKPIQAGRISTLRNHLGLPPQESEEVTRQSTPGAESQVPGLWKNSSESDWKFNSADISAAWPIAATDFTGSTLPRPIGIPDLHFPVPAAEDSTQ